MKILITGINGFVGKILKQALGDRGHLVYGLDISSDSEHVFAVDIRNYLAVKETVLKIDPDLIIHLAAISRVDFENVNDIYEINVNGTLNLLKTCALAKNKIPFIFVSSSQVYGNPNLKDGQMIREEFLLVPVNHYGASKAAAENIALAFHRENGLPLTIVRPFNHTGAGQTVNFVVPKIVKAFKMKNQELHLGNIDTIRDFLDVRDVVNAYVKLIENFKDGEIINIASGKGIVIREIIGLLENISGHKINIKHKDQLMRGSEINALIGDSSKLQNNFNWHPQYSFEDTLKWMLE